MGDLGMKVAKWPILLTYFFALVLAVVFQNCGGQYESVDPSQLKGSKGIVEFNSVEVSPEDSVQLNMPDGAGNNQDGYNGGATRNDLNDQNDDSDSNNDGGTGGDSGGGDSGGGNMGGGSSPRD